MKANGHSRFDKPKSRTPNSKDEAIFDRDRKRDNFRPKRKFEDRDNDDYRGSKPRHSDPFPVSSKFSGNQYEQDNHYDQEQGAPYMNNGPMSGNNMGGANMRGGNMGDGSFQPPLPPMPPPMTPVPQNQIMMPNMMGMMPNMMGGANQMMNPMNMASMMMGQFPMMPQMTPGGPDTNTMGMAGNGMMGPLGNMQMMPEFMNVFSKINTRERIEFSNFILYPPPPNAPPPTTRERPLGCKTIFIGGLPENFKENQLEELFSKCGELQNIRLSSKRFAHIRFMSEMSVDIALYFSGYRIRIEDLTDNENTGRLHIDFAQARDDQYEYECQQRALDRERRHQARMLQEHLRGPSPPTVAHYSENEAAALAEKLKSEDTFQEALDVMCTWLERGDCSKRNATTFYSLLQSTNSHVRHLVSWKATIDDDLQRAKDMHAVKIAALGNTYNTVEKVFSAASQKKVWDHFTKAQRKSIEAWKKAAADIKVLMPDEDNMDTDSEDEDAMKNKFNKGGNKQALKDENDSLRCQLEAYKNEVEILKIDMQTELDAKENKLKVTQKTLENVQMNLMEAKQKHTEAGMKAMTLNKELLNLKLKLKEEGKIEDDKLLITEDDKDAMKVDDVSSMDIACLSAASMNEIDAKLIGLISIFLHIHPFGASVEYIWSYVQKFAPSVKSSDLESAMSRYPLLFKQELFGIGANIERRWKYAVINSTLSE